MNPRQHLEHYDVIPKKSLGQNFMHDPNLIDKIVATAELQPNDTVIEIGAGTGELTERLAQAAGRVISVEIDERLTPLLEERFESTKNVYLVFDDVLKTDLLALAGTRDYRVVANVPYYITSAILRHVLEPSHRPRRIVMVMQYEVAERITATVKTEMSLLAVSVQFYGKPRIVSRLKPAVFWPRPDVDSALVVIDTYPKPPVDVPDDESFFKVVRAGFSQKRKQIKNSLAGGLNIKSDLAEAYLKEAGLDSQRRAETMALEEWASLARVVAKDQ